MSVKMQPEQNFPQYQQTYLYNRLRYHGAHFQMLCYVMFQLQQDFFVMDSGSSQIFTLFEESRCLG